MANPSSTETSSIAPSGMKSPANLTWIRFFQVLIIFGIAMKLYGINDPWKRNDHYNFGGINTTTFAECLKRTPLSISKGVPHYCQQGTDVTTLVPYKAHPPTILFGFWAWTSIFGSAEWAYRLFIFLFSTMNIGLIFLIGRSARPDDKSGVFPWAAAAFQAVFLGNIYFGTHLDFIGEFTVFFLLLTAWAALRQRLNLACILALCAGLSSWPGYISFGPLFIYSLLIKKGRKRIFLMGVFALACALAEMMWLHQTFDIVDFLKMKLLDPGYIQKTEKGWAEPLRFFHNFVTSMSRLLSPLLASIAFLELLRLSGTNFFQPKKWTQLSPLHHAVLLTSGTGLLYALMGHEYFMVHVYLYLLFTPGLALLCAQFCLRWTDQTVDHSQKPFDISEALFENRNFFCILALAIVACYPYGIYKTNAIHDAINSCIFILTTLSLVYLIYKKSLSGQAVLLLTALTAIGNASQVANYRNELDTERSFCESARAEYNKTHQTVETTEEESNAKKFLYCVGIPIHYVKGP